MVSRRRRNTSLVSGGCVVIVSSCEEGAGSSTAIGQTSMVHGVAGAGMVDHAPPAREVGVSRTAANNWARGYKTYRRGQLIGFVPALDRLAVRQISERYLSQDERIEIADLRRAGLSTRQIADKLGRAPSTVSRELRRNGRRDGAYRPFEAHRRAVLRRAPHVIGGGSRRTRSCSSGARVARPTVEPATDQPGICDTSYPEDRSMWLCHESIYQAIYQPRSRLIRPPAVGSAPRVPLRTGRTIVALISGRAGRRPRFAQPMLSIHQRPFDPGDRSQAGHWEGDSSSARTRARRSAPSSSGRPA